ncbi:MAG TPA: hypothetical protein VEG38_18370 [Acidimicrobiia bacterium]|nr:hypothetical protein [Acidimicrobiia bacterium]
MRCLPFRRRALMGATAFSVVVLPVVLLPSAARADAPNPSACRSLYHGTPPGSLTITTDPPSGAVLHPGDTVEVTATWDTSDWPRPVLHKVLDCVLVDGEVDYGLSQQEKPTDNDGLYRYRFTVPTRPAARICDRVRLSGRLVEDGPHVVQKSNTICFPVAGAGGTGTPVKPAEVVNQAATPADAAPAPLEPAPPAPEAPVEEVPAPALELSAVAVPTLPRTGSDAAMLARLGSLLVVLGATVLTARAALSRS